MAEDQDDSQKTEEPTQRRLDEAREKGQVAKSQEVSHWLMILAFTIVVGFMAQSLVVGLGQTLVPLIEQSYAIRLDRPTVNGLLADTAWRLAGTLLPVMGILLVAAALAGIVQNGFLLSGESVAPKLEKLSLLKGLKRLFSLRSIAEFAKGIAKLAIVAAVMAAILWPERNAIPNLATLTAGQFLEELRSLSFRLLIAVLSVMTIIAGLDYLFQKLQHLKQLRMSKQELKDEFKQTEGDPTVKARLRQIRTERARRRMMAAVPEADVVVTNPTHYAVALKYEAASMEAPKVVAKGADFVAQKIRELARENKVPLVENPPLARALYGTVELDQEVPPEHYKAVAAVIGYVMRLKTKGRNPGRPSQPLRP